MTQFVRPASNTYTGLVVPDGSTTYIAGTYGTLSAFLGSGPTGDTGPAGATGPTGPAGATGGSGGIRAGIVPITIPAGTATSTAAVAFSPALTGPPAIAVGADTGTLIPSFEHADQLGFTARLTARFELAATAAAELHWHAVPLPVEVWVANNLTSSIVRLTSAGGAAGAALTGNGLSGPFAMARVAGQIWVANFNTSTISRFFPDGTSAGAAFTGPHLSQPTGIAVAAGLVWVSNWSGGYISLFAPDGTPFAADINNGLFDVGSICNVPPLIWIEETASHTIFRYQYTGVAFGPNLSGNGLNDGFAMATIGTACWVGNSTVHTISRFNLDGTVDGAVVNLPSPVNPGGFAQLGGEVWVTDNSGGQIVRRLLDGSTGSATLTGIGLSGPRGIVAIPLPS